MLLSASALREYDVSASDGQIGAVGDLLFDDDTWKIHWLVVDAATWLPGHSVLIHPAAVQRPDHQRQVLPVGLTMAQIRGDCGSDQVEAIAVSSRALSDAAGAEAVADRVHPRLRSVATITGYGIHAIDGEIGSVETFLLNDSSWGIRYLVVSAKDLSPRQRVLVSPYAVREIDPSDRQVRIEVSRSRFQESPPWNPVGMIDRAYEERLHTYYGWPGYGS